MRSGTQANVGLAGPVGRIVHGFVPRQGPVGDFVMMISCGPEFLADEFVLRPALFVRQFGDAPIGNHPRQGAALLHAQLVRRDMFGPPLQHLVQRAPQHCTVHSRNSGDKVDAPVERAGRRKNPPGLAGAVGGVAAVHPAEHSWIQALHPHRDAVHAQRQQTLHVQRTALHYVFRIHFDGKFLPIPLYFPQLLHYPLQTLQWQNRRSPAPHVERPHSGRSGDLIPPRPDLGADIVGIALEQVVPDCGRGRPRPRKALPTSPYDLGIEIAVGAETAAERNVNVNHRAGWPDGRANYSPLKRYSSEEITRTESRMRPSTSNPPMQRVKTRRSSYM